MLINFSVSNWMSFRDETTFSMIATNIRKNKERLPFIKKYKKRILPISSIYGGNASGKTNFFSAIDFVKYMVIRGTDTDSNIEVERFLLDEESHKNPAYFSIMFLVDEIIYELSFSTTDKKICEEKLIKITSSSETVIYNRKDDKFEGSIFNKDEDFLTFVGRSTRDNQLFINHSVSQNVKELKPVYNWFKKKLTLISHDNRFGSMPFLFFSYNKKLYEEIANTLNKLDTGITEVGLEKQQLKHSTINDDIKKDIEKNIKDNNIGINIINGVYYIATKEEKEVFITKFITFHNNVMGEQIPFDISKESDGTKRLIHLLPIWLSTINSDEGKVIIIDELDTSLHTLLTRNMIEMYLDSCNADTRNQVLFSTHDILLMTQDIFRRDEMWITERGNDGNSTLRSISDYEDIRSDKDIMKSYLLGRFGGVPNIY